MVSEYYEKKCQNLQSDRRRPIETSYTSPTITLIPNSFSRYLYYTIPYNTLSCRFRYSIPYTNTISYRVLPRLTPLYGVFNGIPPALNFLHAGNQ